MRLSKQYIDVFVQVISIYLKENTRAELRLYGSRVNDELKGGDIDLLLLVDSEKLAQNLKMLKPEIFGKIFTYIDEQKIDLLITDFKNLEMDMFVQMIMKDSVLIYSWGDN